MNAKKLRAYNAEASWRHQLKTRGATPDDYHRLVMKQRGRCAICKSTSNAGRRWCLDHDHATGLLRGLLCTACNAGLGLFGDSAARLNAAASYLKHHSEK